MRILVGGILIAIVVAAYAYSTAVELEPGIWFGLGMVFAIGALLLRGDE